MTQLTTALPAVQAALHQRLFTDATLTSALTGAGVFDEVPENAPGNYITIANNIELPANTFGRRGRMVTITLDIWTQPLAVGEQVRGFAPALAILAQCIALLDNKPLALSSGVMSWLQYAGAPQMVRDPDDQVTRHVVARFTGLVEE